MIFVVGFPYVRERYFATFRRWPVGGELRFLLPKRWTAKSGKVVFTPPRDPGVATTYALFHRHRPPLIGGLLKGWMPAFPLHLWRLRKNVRLVYACSEPTLLTTLWLALWSRIMGKKFVCFTWENVPYEKKLRGLSRFVHVSLLAINLRLSHGLICGNPEGVAIHSPFMGNKRLTVIPMNGLDPHQFTKLSIEPSALSSRMVFTFVGALGYRKGIHVILEAFPRVLSEIPEAHLVIAGSGEYEGELERLISSPILRGHVTRVPWVEHRELQRLLSASDVFLYPSIEHRGWAEQFGYSMAEASLMELPVIATRTGSIAEVVRDGETGILVPPSDVGALAEAMVLLGTNAELRRKMGVAGRRFITEHYSHDIVARKMYDFLSHV